MTCAPLTTIGQFVKRSDSIITVDTSGSLLVNTTKKIESVVGHKSSAVQSVPEKLSHTFSIRLSSVLSLVHLDLGDQVLMQDLDIGNHTT